MSLVFLRCNYGKDMCMHEKSTPHFKYFLAVMMRITIKKKPHPKHAIDDNIILRYGILHII